MTWPKEYGGHERSQLERYVVIEELLAAGAPVGAHWIADRQSGPLLLRLGNEELKRRWVPAIARGEAFACIGLSEPGIQAPTSHRSAPPRAAMAMNGCSTGRRSGPRRACQPFHDRIGAHRGGSERQQGLSQLVVPMDTPGVTRETDHRPDRRA